MGPKLSVSVRVAGRAVFVRADLAMSTSIPPREMPRGLFMCSSI